MFYVVVLIGVLRHEHQEPATQDHSQTPNAVPAEPKASPASNEYAELHAKCEELQREHAKLKQQSASVRETRDATKPRPFNSPRVPVLCLIIRY